MPATVAATEQQLDRIIAQLNTEEVTAEILRGGGGCHSIPGTTKSSQTKGHSNLSCCLWRPRVEKLSGSKAI